MKDELTRIGLTLPSYKRISGLTIVTTPLPRTRLEKIQRYRVAAMVKTAGEAAEPAQPLAEADQALMETAVARVIVRAFQPFLEKERRIVPGDHLDLDLGFDSLRRVELMSALEQSFGRLPDSISLSGSKRSSGHWPGPSARGAIAMTPTSRPLLTS